MRPVQAFESVSTWWQPLPPAASPARSALIEDVAARVAGVAPGRLRVAIDGLTCAGKTSFGHELAAALRELGRPTARASLDDFKNPWREAREQGYDRLSGEGYYRNAYDFASARHLLLAPAGPGGPGVLVLCGHDPLTGEDHRGETVATPAGTVLIVDSVFAFRPEYNEFWDYRIWLEVGAAESLRRAVVRDAPREGAAGAERLHRDRYHAAEAIYRAEVDPLRAADLVIDNSDIAAPRILSAGGRRSG
jgi:uridine kinase